jgi:hypothetical protein
MKKIVKSKGLRAAIIIIVAVLLIVASTQIFKDAGNDVKKTKEHLNEHH